jgi:hypothetical protein
VAQTDPRDAQSRFQVTAWRVTPGDQGLSFAWLGATNRNVYLDWRSALESGGFSGSSWFVRTHLPLPAGCLNGPTPLAVH